MTHEEIAEEYGVLSAAGRQLRTEYPYEDNQPPSKVWQEELYDEQGVAEMILARQED